ncbi:hypothetical protein ACHAWO_011418 [Cyclotella atomus]|uniref:Uncharacterized protein n=1 Tax=Cyclotella atomus TaxID=382360 RepID=A0ABD3NFP2_9STRA
MVRFQLDRHLKHIVLPRIQRNDPEITELSIVVDDEFAAVVEEAGRAIRDHSFIECLSLDFQIEGVDVEFYRPLFRGISRSKSISVLSIINSDDNLWEALAYALPNMTIRKLDIACRTSSANSRISASLALLSFRSSMAIAEGLVLNNTIEDLKSSGMIWPQEAMLVMAPAIFGPDSAIKRVDFSDWTPGDAVYQSIVEALGSNRTLEELKGLDLQQELTDWWTGFSQALANHLSALKKVVLKCVVTDDVLLSFAQALRHNSTLTCLDLSFVNRGLVQRFVFLSDDERSILIVTRRRSLAALSQVGWRAITRLVNDTSDINATRYSNHTLCDLGCWDDDDDFFRNMRFYFNDECKEAFDTTKRLLEMNKEEDKNKVARRKVIQHHFANGTFDLAANRALIGDRNKILPQTMHWFGRDKLGGSVLFDLVRKSIGLFEDANPSLLG